MVSGGFTASIRPARATSVHASETGEPDLGLEKKKEQRVFTGCVSVCVCPSRDASTQSEAVMGSVEGSSPVTTASKSLDLELYHDI